MDMTDTVRSGSPWPSHASKTRKAHAYRLIDEALRGEPRRAARWWLHHRCQTGEHLEKFIARMQARIDNQDHEKETLNAGTGEQATVDLHASV